MPLNEIKIRKAMSSDIGNLKTLADAHKNELGFVLRPALAKSVGNRSVLVAVTTTDHILVGFVDYHHRKDAQTTLYHLVVSSDQRGNGIGRALVDSLRIEALTLGKHCVILKCPEELMANDFYLNIGFELVATENGKARRLNVWRLDLV